MAEWWGPEPQSHTSGRHKTFRGPSTFWVKEWACKGKLVGVYVSISVHLFVYYLFSSPELLGKSCLELHAFRKKRWEVRRAYPPGEILSGPWKLMTRRPATLVHLSPPPTGICFGSWTGKKLMDTWDDPPLDHYLTKGRCPWVKQAEKVICLETVDMQSDSLRGICDQRESGKWLERLGAWKADQLGFQVWRHHLHLCSSGQGTLLLRGLVISSRRNITPSLLIPWHTQFVKSPTTRAPLPEFHSPPLEKGPLPSLQGDRETRGSLLGREA